MLTIAILTRNRHKYFYKVLDEIQVQRPSNVIVKVFDNASTPPVEVPADVELHTAMINRGFAGNFKHAVLDCETEYLWVVPDDRIVLDNTIRDILLHTSLGQPDLLVLPDNKLEHGFSGTAEEFFAFAKTKHRELILSAGNIGSVIFKPKLFNWSLFNLFIGQDWSYPHLPAILNAVNDVFVLQGPCLANILPRLPAPDFAYSTRPTEWQWRKCIEFINGRFHAGIDFQAEEKRMNAWFKERLKKEPIKLFLEYRNELVNPTRWAAAVTRLWKSITQR